MGVQPPEAPDIPEQNIITQHQDIQDSAPAAHSDSTLNSHNLPSLSSVDDQVVSSASEILTGNSRTLENLAQPHGIDISSHQHNSRSIDIPTAIDGGQEFVFVKATEGTDYVNPHFRSDVIKAMDKDVPVGFYHYAKPSNSLQDAKKQAQAFVKKTGIDRGVKSLPPVLDIEEDNGVDNAKDLIAWTQQFVNEVKTLTGQEVMIYTYPSFWKNEMGNTSAFNNLPLWIADYNNSTQPGSLIGGWDDWTFWQYSSDGLIDGYHKNIDVNLFNGSKQELVELYNNSTSSSTSSSSGSGKSSSNSTRTTVTETVVIKEELVL